MKTREIPKAVYVDPHGFKVYDLDLYWKALRKFADDLEAERDELRRYVQDLEGEIRGLEHKISAFIHKYGSYMELGDIGDVY